MQFVAGLIGGFVVAVLGSILLVTVFAASPGIGAAFGLLGFAVIWLIGIVIAATAPSPAKAWRRLLLSSAILAFSLPLSGIIFTGSMMATHVDPHAQHAGAAAAGMAIGGGIISGILGFIGFFVGLVFLVIGLLVGRDKQIVYVQAAPSIESSIPDQPTWRRDR